MKNMLSTHTRHDWCHVCGKHNSTNANVFYAHNAEYAGLGDPNHADKYIRICLQCSTCITEKCKQTVQIMNERTTNDL